jgi:hypothetical protein
VPGMRSVFADEVGSNGAGVATEPAHRARMACVLEATRTQAVRIDSSADVTADWD